MIGRVQVVYGGDWPVLLGSASLKDFTVALKKMVFLYFLIKRLAWMEIRTGVRD